MQVPRMHLFLLETRCFAGCVVVVARGLDAGAPAGSAALCPVPTAHHPLGSTRPWR